MSVRQRDNCFQVIYRCPGEKTPRTESFQSEEEAILRYMQIKLAKKNGTFNAPQKLSKKVIQVQTEITVEDFLKEYVQQYGVKKWGNSYYSACMSLIANYINPHIGNRYVRSITVRDLDQYYTSLLDMPAVVTPGHDIRIQVLPSLLIP